MRCACTLQAVSTQYRQQQDSTPRSPHNSTVAPCSMLLNSHRGRTLGHGTPYCTDHSLSHSIRCTRRLASVSMALCADSCSACYAA